MNEKMEKMIKKAKLTSVFYRAIALAGAGVSCVLIYNAGKSEGMIKGVIAMTSHVERVFDESFSEKLRQNPE